MHMNLHFDGSNSHKNFTLFIESTLCYSNHARIHKAYLDTVSKCVWTSSETFVIVHAISELVLMLKGKISSDKARSLQEWR